jgi:ABC-type lipoprotein release transport system permease subunit
MLFIFFTFLQIRRHAGKNLTLSLLIALLTSLAASVFIFENALREEVTALSEFFPDLTVQKNAGGRLMPIEGHLTDSLKKFTGVKHVEGRIFGYTANESSGAILTIWASENQLYGNSFSENKPDTSEIIVGRGYSDLTGLNKGDFVSLREANGKNHSFKIRAVLGEETAILTQDLLILHPSSARKMLSLQDSDYTDAAIWLSNELETENLARKIGEKFAGLRVNTRRQLKASYLHVFSHRSGLFFSILSVLFASFAVLIWERISPLNSSEREEMSLLKAVGWSVPLLLQVRLAETFFTALTGIFAGFSLAYFHLELFDAWLIKNFIIGDGVLIPSFTIHYDYSFSIFISLTAGILLPYMSASIIPAWRAAVSEPL